MNRKELKPIRARLQRLIKKLKIKADMMFHWTVIRCELTAKQTKITTRQVRKSFCVSIYDQ